VRVEDGGKCKLHSLQLDNARVLRCLLSVEFTENSRNFVTEYPEMLHH